MKLKQTGPYHVPRSRRSQARSPWFLVSLSVGEKTIALLFDGVIVSSGGPLELVYSYVAWEVNIFAVNHGIVLWVFRSLLRRL